MRGHGISNGMVPPGDTGRGARGGLRRVCGVAAVCAAALALAACLGQSPSGRAADAGLQEHTVWVVSNGWHTGIVLARDAATADGRIAEAAALPPSGFLEFGWGDRTFYPDPDPGKLAALRAGLTPTDAVIRIDARGAPPQAGRVRAVPVSAATRDAIAAAIDRAFARPPGGGAARPLAAGTTATSLFFPAHGTFHLFNTCNTWVARILQQAGLSIHAAGVVTSDGLMDALDAMPGMARPQPAAS